MAIVEPLAYFIAAWTRRLVRLPPNSRRLADLTTVVGDRRVRMVEWNQREPERVRPLSHRQDDWVHLRRGPRDSRAARTAAEPTLGIFRRGVSLSGC